MIRFLFVFILFSSWAFSQETFQWNNGVCLMKGEVNPLKATKEQLFSIQNYLITTPEFVRPVLPSRMKDTFYIRLDLVLAECASKLAELETIDLPNESFWKEIRLARIKEVKEECELREQAIQAYENPELLKQTRTCDSCEEIIQDLIKGGEALLKRWEKLVRVSMVNANNPEFIQAVYEYYSSDKDALLYAKMEVMQLAWWNCAHEQLFTVQQYSEMEQQFEVLLKNVTKSCL